jgi:hypothetical protein
MWAENGLQVAVHLVVPHGVEFDQAHVNFDASLNCEQMPSKMLQLLTANRELARVRPPAGLLRNVALEHCHNEWRVSIDPQMTFPLKVLNLCADITSERSLNLIKCTG